MGGANYVCDRLRVHWVCGKERCSEEGEGEGAEAGVDGGGGVGACDGEHGEVGEAGGGSVQGKAGKVVSEKHGHT